MLQKMLRDTSGNFAMMTAIMVIPLALTVGLGVDYSRAVSAKSQLQDMADSAALALATSPLTDTAALSELAQKYVIANNDLRSETTNHTIAKLDTSNKQIKLVLTAQMPTYFMGLAGYHTIDLSAQTVAERVVSGGIEVAMVLDNTDSMNVDDKIGTLKTAATNLTDELFANPNANVRVALVPYAEQVNVGMANRNASWIDVPPDYDHITNVAGYWYQPKRNTGVCLEERPAGGQWIIQDGIEVWQAWEAGCIRWEIVDDGPPVWREPYQSVTSFKWFGCVGARVKSGALVLNDEEPSIKYPGFLFVNQRCLTEILPLTNSQSTVKAAITAMVTSKPGYIPNTYIPNGMMWGINVLSKKKPYDEGEAYDINNKNPRKVIVLMTDGINTRKINFTTHTNHDYLYYSTQTGDNNWGGLITPDEKVQVDNDTKTLCNYAKDKKIEIFTVAFKVEDQPESKQMLKDCSSDPDTHYFDATSNEALLEAFKKIGQSLSVVRLVQ